MEKNKTAVEWLENELNQKGKLTPVDFYQAKALEKQQIIDARQSHPIQMKRLGWKVNISDGEEYYNETYGGNE